MEEEDYLENYFSSVSTPLINPPPLGSDLEFNPFAVIAPTRVPNINEHEQNMHRSIRLPSQLEAFKGNRAEVWKDGPPGGSTKDGLYGEAGPTTVNLDADGNIAHPDAMRIDQEQRVLSYLPHLPREDDERALTNTDLKPWDWDIDLRTGRPGSKFVGYGETEYEMPPNSSADFSKEKMFGATSIRPDNTFYSEGLAPASVQRVLRKPILRGAERLNYVREGTRDIPFELPPVLPGTDHRTHLRNRQVYQSHGETTMLNPAPLPDFSSIDAGGSRQNRPTDVYLELQAMEGKNEEQEAAIQKEWEEYEKSNQSLHQIALGKR